MYSSMRQIPHMGAPAVAISRLEKQKPSTRLKSGTGSLQKAGIPEASELIYPRSVTKHTTEIIAYSATLVLFFISYPPFPSQIVGLTSI